MTGMPSRWIAPLACLLLGALLVSCGGGSSPADETPRITDPNTAPTATALSDAVKYEIRGGAVSIPDATTTAVAATPSASGGGSYTIEPGDSCGAIASKLGITPEELMAANPGINADCTNLQPGQQLNAPGAPAQPTPEPGETPSGDGGTPSASGEVYVVQPGDTCVDVATSFGVDAEDLRVLNGLDADCSLSIGQELQIP